MAPTAKHRPGSVDQPIVLTGCGIMSKEIGFLIQKNGWPLKTSFACSSLHVDFEMLERTLDNTLARLAGQPALVFYGACHPQMHQILQRHRVKRTEGQNCVEMLLGPEVFSRELAGNSFFLMEDWARRWKLVIGRSFGERIEVFQEILRTEHSSMLALRTPCSDDFTKLAESIAHEVGLPLRWMAVSLDHLEHVLEQALFNQVEQ